MQRLRMILPSPNLLVTFEAAGRLLSFTVAATELNVTRVAVSQQVRALENFLGVPLFYRLHRSIQLTAVGERYHRAVSAALEQMVRATTEITKVVDSNVVNIMATTGFTTYWLIPNIGDFRQKHPKVELRFIISDSPLDLINDNIDVAIRYGDPPFPGHNADLLVREVIAPTCAAGFVEPGRTLSPGEIIQYPLIHLDGPYDEQTRWQHWFRAQGIEWRSSQAGITVNTYTNLVQAAIDGQGFALVGTPLIERYLESGTLVQPIEAPPIERRSFYLVTPSNRKPSPVALVFCAWLQELFDQKSGDLHLNSLSSDRF